MIKKTKISVVVITYNQEATIRQTLDSILMQKGNFDLEVVIGEDCSPDNTLAVCRDYAQHYQKQIKLFSGPKNLGIMANTARVYQAATGNFISIIAGDDYYIDDHALEKQMRYMQEHPDVGVLGANGYQYFLRTQKKVPTFNPVIAAGQGRAKEFFFNPQYKGGIYIWPIGLMIRREILRYIDFEEIIRRKLPFEDYPMQAIWSQHTQFACLSDLLVMYRVYANSSSFISFDHPKYMEITRGLIETRRYLNELFPADTCFTDEMLQEQLFYKEFLLYLHRYDYSKAKQLIKEAPESIQSGEKVLHAKRFTRTWLHFICAHIAKEMKYKQELNKQI